MKKYAAILFLILAALACNVSVSEVFDQGGGDDEFYDEVEYSRSLTATLFQLETIIAEATATSAAQTEAARPASADPAATETPVPKADQDAFCDVYEAYVSDLFTRVDAYERAVAADDGTGHGIAVEADHAIEAYMDQLVPHAPDEVRPSVEALANMSLIGLLSSQEQFPAAEPHFEILDDYATDNCDDSFGLREE